MNRDDRELPSKEDMRKYLDPLNNWMFLKIFGSDDSRRVSRALANAVLRGVGLEPIGDVDEIRADTLIPNSVGLKSPRADVLLVCGDRLIDMEAQKSKSDIENKVLYYAASLLVSHMRKGRGESGVDYGTMPQVVTIMFLKGEVKFPNTDQFITIERLHWENNAGYHPGTDRFVFVLCEMDKVARRYNEANDEVLGNELTTWLYVLSKGFEDEEAKKQMVSDPAVAEFIERYNLALDDDDAWWAYECSVRRALEENTLRNNAKRSGLKEGREEGFKEGRAQGRAEGRAEERARNLDLLRKAGADEELIAKFEALSEAEPIA